MGWGGRSWSSFDLQCFLTCCITGDSELTRGWTQGHSASQGPKATFELLSRGPEHRSPRSVNPKTRAFFGRVGSTGSNPSHREGRAVLRTTWRPSFPSQSPGQQRRASLCSPCAGGGPILCHLLGITLRGGLCRVWAHGVLSAPHDIDP